MPVLGTLTLQFAALEARAQALQDELTAAYKEKAALAEQSLQATRQLQVRSWFWLWFPLVQPCSCSAVLQHFSMS